WYGTDLDEANTLLAGAADITLARKAEVFKQVLSLLIAQRRPSYYLVDGRQDLTALTNQYLRLISDAGIIDKDLREVALRAPLTFLSHAPSPPALSFVERKATTAAQSELLRLLGSSSLYDL